MTAITTGHTVTTADITGLVIDTYDGDLTADGYYKRVTIRLADGTTVDALARDCAVQTTAEGDRLREASKHHITRKYASIDNSDTDGFVSQWASGISAREDALAAEIADKGGRHCYQAMFDLDGNLIAAKEIKTRYGYRWGILADDDPRGEITQWVSESQARDPQRARKANAAKGFYIGRVMATATAALSGSGTGLSGAMSVAPYARRTDGGFSRDVIVIDNGQD